MYKYLCVLYNRICITTLNIRKSIYIYKCLCVCLHVYTHTPRAYNIYYNIHISVCVALAHVKRFRSIFIIHRHRVFRSGVVGNERVCVRKIYLSFIAYIYMCRALCSVHYSGNTLYTLTYNYLGRFERTISFVLYNTSARR